jgi:hypothetical protein
MEDNDIHYALLCHKIERNTFLFNLPSRKASAFGRRSRPMADEDGGREGQV